MRKIALVTLAAIWLCASHAPQAVLSEESAQHSTKAVPVTGLFSDMHLNPETGDIGGTEILIVKSMDEEVDEYFAFVQFAFGRPKAPVMVKVRVTSGANIEFTIPESEFGSFRGRVSATALTGAFVGNDTPIRLSRGKSYWQ